MATGLLSIDVSFVDISTENVLLRHLPVQFARGKRQKKLPVFKTKIRVTKDEEEVDKGV